MSTTETAASRPNENIIEVRDLTVSFGGFNAVDGISFDVKRGEIFGFLGANGAGKTTTIRTLCGILNPARGSVKVEGRDVSSSTAVLKPLIGYMSQKFTLYRDLSIAENISFAGSLYDMPPARVKARAAELFDFIKLREPQDTIAGDLPGGARQTVALCAALLHDPQLIFLDEPTAGAAPRSREDFWALIRALASRGKTVFVTTHYMDEARYCARIALMDRGRIIALASPRELKKIYNAQNLDEVFIKAMGAGGAR
ncbi:MAG: ABC transporter ATP-binding protein [Elusimicrobiota bacterium]|jgi:ABC-2 type transport system ATP-binding protein|nr:ABC transporter ATP-binding protein [Elusimicrobiota bacterium]